VLESIARPPHDELERPVARPSARAYRPDIDGLRAVAIVLVVLSHLGLKKTAGGFVGVDIFFVISGYLLTGNIAHSIATGRFSIAGFYERRIRRIFPALVVMLVATSILAYAVFPSKALVLFGESLAAALFSYSNFYFFTQPDGYFSNTFTKLLLHTWSLGVEEQFYLVLPVCMLWAARRQAKATRWFVCILGIVSFSCATYFTYADRNLAFYMPYTRAWEFLIGSALALRMLPSPQSRPLREAMAASSVLLIGYCLVSYTASTSFPGLAALAPCVAAALLISIGERGRTTIGSFLTWRPIVFIGVISYSLYLWHWPVMLFLRLGLVPDYGKLHVLAVAKIALSLILATLSWRFIERPFLVGRWRSLPKANVFLAAGFCTAAVAVVAIAFVGGRGLPQRLPATADIAGNYLYHDSTRRAPGCFVETNFAVFDPAICLARKPYKINLLLFGDSHANSLWFGLSQSLADANVLQATASACAPVRGNYDSSACGSLRRFMYERYLPKHRVDMVILTEAWRTPADLEVLEPALVWFRANRIPVIVIGPGPEYSAALPLLLSLGERWHVPGLAAHRLIRKAGDLDRMLGSKLAARAGVRYASVWQALCSADRCQEYVDRERGIPTLLDHEHLSDEGAILAVRRMLSAGEFRH
jgi:peptidoglycan/LPS O-acetylase OafA/YrhL